jgi:hypothetical protein
MLAGSAIVCEVVFTSSALVAKSSITGKAGTRRLVMMARATPMGIAHLPSGSPPTTRSAGRFG